VGIVREPSDLDCRERISSPISEVLLCRLIQEVADTDGEQDIKGGPLSSAEAQFGMNCRDFGLG